MRSSILLITLSFGLQFAVAQSEPGLVETLTAQNANVDALTEQLIPELNAVMPSDSARASLAREQARWSKDRTKQCRKEARGFPREQRLLREQQCRYDSGVRRLEELLARYDDLAPQ